MKNTFLTFIALLCLITVTSNLCLAQTNTNSPAVAKPLMTKKEKKIRNKVINIGPGGKITVIKHDKNKFYGKVVAYSDDTFSIREVDLKTDLTFKYSEINKIHRGDGEKNLITGKRNNPQKGWLYGLAIIGTLVVITLVTVSDKDF